MVYNQINIDQMTCTGVYLLPRGDGTYEAIFKYATNDGRKVTMEGIVSHFRPQFEIYNDYASGTINFVFEKNIDKNNNLFTMRIEDK